MKKVQIDKKVAGESKPPSKHQVITQGALTPNALLSKLKATHAFIGDKILFKRKGRPLQGTVVEYRQDTVLVEIPIHQAALLGLENAITVVNHKNYEVL